MFNVLEECVIMAAGMGCKNIFSFPYAEQLRAYQMKMNWAEGSFSDPITILNAYQVWKEHCHSDYFRRSGQTEHEREAQWARKSFVQLRALKVSSFKSRNAHSLSSVAFVVFFLFF
jgi:ATP-dependent RNA helicase TDRD9